MRTTYGPEKMQLLPDLNEPEALSPIDADTSLAFLRAVYSDPSQPMQRRMRAAIAALPFEHPKLAVTANINGGPGFAARLEAAIAKTAEMRAGQLFKLSAEIPENSGCVSLAD